MLDLRGGVGWELARAAVHAWSPRYDGPPDPAPDDGRYRQTVLRSQVHRQLLGRAVEQLDTYELARFYGHLSRRYCVGGVDDERARAADGDAWRARCARCSPPAWARWACRARRPRAVGRDDAPRRRPRGGERLLRKDPIYRRRP